MLQTIKRKVGLGIGILAVGVLAVACAGAPQFGATTGFQASIGGFTFQLPPVTLPFVSAAPKQASSQTTTTTNTALEGAVHSGEGCPIALPEE